MKLPRSLTRALALCLVLLSVLTWIPLGVSAAEKYMEGKNADFTVVLDESGGATVTETWECFFGGGTITRYRRHYKVPAGVGSSIQVEGISMDGEAMELLDAPDENRPQGFAAVFEDGDGVHMEMYLKAKNETHTFEITYYVANAVILYNDCAEFHWNLVSENEAFGVETVDALIEIPYGTKDMGLYFWGHGPTDNAYFDARVEDGMVHQFDLHTENTYPGRGVSVRFAMPLELFPNGSRFVDEDAIETIRAEEHDLAASSGSSFGTPTGDPTDPADPTETTPDEPYVPSDDPWYEDVLYEISSFFSILTAIVLTILAIVAVALCAVPILLVLVFSPLLMRYGERHYLKKKYEENRHKPVQAPDYYRSLPDDMKPALVRSLMTVYPTEEGCSEIIRKGNAFSATILDLVERGLIRLETDAEGTCTYQVVPGAWDEGLTDYEKKILELYITAGADQHPMTTTEVTTYMRDHYSWCKDIYREFGELVKQDFEATGLTVSFPHQDLGGKTEKKLGILSGVIIFFGLLRPVGFFGSLGMGVMFGLVNAAAANIILKTIHPDFSLLTQEGENRYALWKAYARFLEDFTLFDEKEVGEVKIWRKYLVYAVALGCSDKVLENLKMTCPEVYSAFVNDPYLAHYDEMYTSVTAIDHEGGYTIRSSSSSSGGSSDSGDWGGMSDSGGDSDSGSSGSDFD